MGSLGSYVCSCATETLVVRACADFDAFYETRAVLTASVADALGAILVIATDGKDLVMRRDALREATQRAASRARRKLKRRLSKGEKRNRKRMAQVADVYTAAPFVRTPEDIVGELDRDNETAPKRPRPEHKRSGRAWRRTGRWSCARPSRRPHAATPRGRRSGSGSPTATRTNSS